MRKEKTLRRIVMSGITLETKKQVVIKCPHCG